jgi:hypothetical protein
MIRKMSEDLLWNQVVARAWCDEAFLNRLRSGPRSVLAEHGIDVPEGMEVELAEGEEVAVEDADAVRRFTFPANPPDDLMDEDLVGTPAQWYCGACGGCGRCGACGCRC